LMQSAVCLAVVSVGLSSVWLFRLLRGLVLAEALAIVCLSNGVFLLVCSVVREERVGFGGVVFIAGGCGGGGVAGMVAAGDDAGAVCCAVSRDSVADSAGELCADARCVVGPDGQWVGAAC
jgi:hypothetical protein